MTPGIKGKKFIYLIIAVVVISVGCAVYFSKRCSVNEANVLKKIIARLNTTSRAAELLVTDVNYDEKANKLHTTVKFLEYDIDGSPLIPRYFTFCGNVIQLQSLSIRLNDIPVKKNAAALEGKSVYLFWKVFMLDGGNTRGHVITKINSVPEAYRIKGKKDPAEERLWRLFWRHALNPKRADNIMINNAQLEAPGIMFIPGTIYKIGIDTDAKIKIGSPRLPKIAK